MGDAGRVAIILIYHRMEAHLRSCLLSIRRQITSFPLHVVVVHLAASEGDDAWIRRDFPEAELVAANRFGISHMRNLGLARSGGAGFALILDVDTELRPGSLQALVRFAAAHPRAAATAAQTYRADGSLERNARRFYDWTTIAVRRSPLAKLWPGNPWNRRHLMFDMDWTQPFICDWAAGACLLLRREALEEIGGFDERFTFGLEDTDWAYRAKRAGWEVWHCPEAEIVHHVQRRSARGLNRMALEHLKSLWRFWRKHGRLAPAGERKPTEWAGDRGSSSADPPLAPP